MWLATAFIIALFFALLIFIRNVIRRNKSFDMDVATQPEYDREAGKSSNNWFK